MATDQSFENDLYCIIYSTTDMAGYIANTALHLFRAYLYHTVFNNPTTTNHSEEMYCIYCIYIHQKTLYTMDCKE